MKRFLLFLFIVISYAAQSQAYNNEWIDYSKTYYKFKVGKTGLYRISQATLSSIGLSATPADQFQLWRNGQQVPIYTSVASGTLGASDYIEFWGEMNDGKPDNILYLDPDYQLCDKWSLESDTAAFFLTVNPSGSNARFNSTANTITGTLSAEPYFMYTAGNYFKQKINPGYAASVGEYVYSSSYDKGEGWTSNDIAAGSDPTTAPPSTVASFNNLYWYSGGPAPRLKIAAAGDAINPRTFRVRVNGDSVIGRQMDYFDYAKIDTTFNGGLLGAGFVIVDVTNQSAISTDRMVVAKCEVIYPRQFNFGGQNNFVFTLPANAAGNYLQITNFNYGSTAPVLYDITNGARYVADISTPSTVKVQLQPSAVERTLVLVSEDVSNITAINLLQTRNFIDYSTTANKGNYLIISHPALFTATDGSNPVEDYRAYRSSTAGGSYISKIYLIDELVDQFGFGIRHHPLSIRNFARYARNTFGFPIKDVMLIGKGINYSQYLSYHIYGTYEDDINKLDFIPTFGQPASDNLLTAEGSSAIPLTPIGRLSAINGDEVEVYLNKVKEYELAQATPSCSIDDKAWMKNVVHVIGASDDNLGQILNNYMNNYQQIISDTLFGASVSTFSKTSADNVEQLTNTQLQALFTQGISLLTYFGHSSSSTLEFNLDNPESYYNPGKYPVFIVMGCNAGNFYNLNPLRLQTKETLSEKFVLSPERGAIAFLASTHFGIVHYLDIYNNKNYTALTSNYYGKTLGEIMDETISQVFNLTTQQDFYARFHCEQFTLHGDPALKYNNFPKPDYAIEEPLINISPSFISVAETSFKVKVKMMNIGRAVNRNIVVETKRQYPDNSIAVIRRDTIPGIRYADSLSFDVPIVATRDKGLNKIIVTLDADNAVDELCETNNTASKDVFIYEDEARPVYPYNFAIVNNPNIKLVASTANPFSALKQYTLEIDTTEFFNSPFKVTRTMSSVGGVLEFTPGITFTDSTVYYWRVAYIPSSGQPVWNTSSFIYLPNSDVGFNQSHLYQHLKSTTDRLYLDSLTRKWTYGDVINNLFLRMGTYVTSGAVDEAALSVSLNGVPAIRICSWFQSVMFNVISPVSFYPLKNRVVVPGTSVANMGQGLYGSLAPQNPYQYAPYDYNFEFRYTTPAYRKAAMDFMRDSIPDGYYVVVRNFSLDPATFPDPVNFPQVFISDWQADASLYGAGNTLYDYLRNAGFAGIDSFYRVRPWGFVYKKNDPSFTPQWIVGVGNIDNPTLSVDCPTKDSIGYITSPVFGPAKAWKKLIWKGNTLDTISSDKALVDVIGVDNTGVETPLFTGLSYNDQDYDISSVSATQYPYIKLKMLNEDTANFTPYQLRYWRLTYVPVPEGAVAPNIAIQKKDTVDIGEPINFKMAFKNVSEVPFDSLLLKMVITDRNNVNTIVPLPKKRPLPINDTINIEKVINTSSLPGKNTMYVEVNPADDQPEQYHFNNFAYLDFYVRPDSLNPLLDVTFDGVHILNNDIVSSKPHITVKLKDEAKWMVLDDTSLLTLQVRYPNGSTRRFFFNNDTLRFNPAGQAPNTDNTASLDFSPYFTEDGNYELEVTGKDKSNNEAGAVDYRVGFQVINKPMISNMLNYPNPFTTSTAFVFTITGSEVPQNIRIQILTITGKIVRDITKEELGPLHIGRNITEFKWDGTDQYGQKLGNGIYLYRVITNLNGKSLDKYKAEGDNTDKYFNKGYGKMYLMR